MSWSLQQTGADATAVTLTPVAGDITVTVAQSTGVFTNLDGSRVVWQSPAQPADPAIPELWFEDFTQLTRLIALCGSGQPLTLTADTGQTWAVRSKDAVKWRIINTPDRGTAAKYGCTLTLVGA